MSSSWLRQCGQFPAVVYVFRVLDGHGKCCWTCFGITNNWRKRKAEHAAKIHKLKAFMGTPKVVLFAQGRNAHARELAMKTELRYAKVSTLRLPGFKTESVEGDHFDFLCKCLFPEDDRQRARQPDVFHRVP